LEEVFSDAALFLLLFVIALYAAVSQSVESLFTKTVIVIHDRDCGDCRNK
jgi:hypothetical protein